MMPMLKIPKDDLTPDIANFKAPNALTLPQIKPIRIGNLRFQPSVALVKSVNPCVINVIVSISLTNASRAPLSPIAIANS
ncbi:hypothetical protein D3C85_1828870 [compost metagenome]